MKTSSPSSSAGTCWRTDSVVTTMILYKIASLYILHPSESRPRTNSSFRYETLKRSDLEILEERFA